VVRHPIVKSVMRAHFIGFSVRWISLYVAVQADCRLINTVVDCGPCLAVCAKVTAK
jgi:hypothetical protein